MGRTWVSQPGGLYLSIVLRLAPHPLLSLALGLATIQTIEDTTGIHADLRWPNDVLIGEKKCAGVLAQAEGDVVIAGIGINVHQQSFPDGLATPATSLALSTARPIPPLEQIAESLRDNVCRWAEQLSHPSVLREEFLRKSSYAFGKRVSVDGLVGVTQGITDQGFLLLRDDAGTLHTLTAGGVRPA